MFGRGNLLSPMVIFCASRRFCEEGASSKIPTGQKCCKIKHLCSFGENSRSSTNFQDSEDVGDDPYIFIGLKGTPQLCPFPSVMVLAGEFLAGVGGCIVDRLGKNEVMELMSSVIANLVMGDIYRLRSAWWPVELLGRQNQHTSA